MCEVAVLPTVCIQQHTALLSTLVLCTLPCLMKHICLPLGWRHSHRTTVINLPWNIPTVKSKGKLTVAPPMCLGLLFLESLENEQMSKQHFIFPYPCSIPLSSDHFLGCLYFSLSFHRQSTVFLPGLWLFSIAKNWTAQTIQLLLRVSATSLCGVLSTFKSESR